MIKRMMRSDDALHLIVQGMERIKVLEWSQTDPHLRARVHVLPPPETKDPVAVEALRRNVQSLIERALAMLPQVPPEVRASVLSANDPVQLSYFLGSVLDLGLEQEQAMLEANTTDELLSLAYTRLAREIEIMQLRSKIASRRRARLIRRSAIISGQQMKTIQKELGDDEGGERAEAEMLRDRLQADLPDEVRKGSRRGAQADGAVAVGRADYHVIRSYLEYGLELRGKNLPKDKIDLDEARRVLD